MVCFLTNGDDQDYLRKLEKCLMREGLDIKLSIMELGLFEEDHDSINGLMTYLVLDARDKELFQKLLKNKDFFKYTSLSSLILVIDKTIDADELKKLLSHHKMIKYLLNRDWGPELHVPALTAFFSQTKSNKTKQELAVMAKKLNKLLAVGAEQAEKIKKIHKRLIKLRSEAIRPFLLTGRYAPGSASGGEFYDIFKTEQELILLITSACTFQSSSAVMSFIAEQKTVKRGVGKLEDLKNLIVSHFQKIGKADALFEFFLMKIDLKNIQSEIYSQGNFILLGNRALGDSKNFIAFDKNKSEISFQYNRGDKIVVLSPGFQKNFKEKTIEGKNYLSFILSKMDEQTKDLLNELFFQLKRISASDFSEYDATIVALEVEINAILQLD